MNEQQYQTPPPQQPVPPQQPMPQQPMPQQPMPSGAPQGGARIGLYILSALIGLAGLIIGIIYLVKPDKDSKKFGLICLLLGLLVGPALVIIIWLITAAAVVSTVPVYY